MEGDIIECVLGLGPNLFYNSSMEACVVVCRMKKPPRTRGKILFINAVDEVTREKSQSFLEEEHIEKILKAFRDFKNIEGFSKVVTIDEIKSNGSNLNMPLYVPNNINKNYNLQNLQELITDWQESSSQTLRRHTQSQQSCGA